MKFCFTIIIILQLFGVNINAQTLTIAAASNTRYAIEEIRKEFIKQTGIKLNMVYASSGKLSAQIMNGAPYDIFISANKIYPQVLFEGGLASDNPKALIKGSLILWTKIKNDFNLKDISLSEISIKTIASANPRSAPYGIAAMDYLKTLNNSTEVLKKLVYLESISQVNQHISLNTVDAAFTSKSFVFTEHFPEASHWVEIDTSLYTPIIHYILLLESDNKEKVQIAQSFYHFLFGEHAAAIFNKFGYYSLIDNNERPSLR